MVELGRVDICLETLMMLSHLTLPHEGHLDVLFNMFAYLKKYHNTEMVFDPTLIEIKSMRKRLHKKTGHQVNFAILIRKYYQGTCLSPGA